MKRFTKALTHWWNSESKFYSSLDEDEKTIVTHGDAVIGNAALIAGCLAIVIFLKFILYIVG